MRLILLLFITAYAEISPEDTPEEAVSVSAVSAEQGGDEDKLPVYTLETLRPFDGSDPTKPILLGLNGKVFDVTKGSKFYAKGMSYAHFAGRDVTRNTAIFSTEDEDLDRTDFPADKQGKLEEIFRKTYVAKYPIVGTLINDTPPPPMPENPPDPQPEYYVDPQYLYPQPPAQEPPQPDWVEENMNTILVTVYVGALAIVVLLYR